MQIINTASATVQIVMAESLGCSVPFVLLLLLQHILMNSGSPIYARDQGRFGLWSNSYNFVLYLFKSAQ